MKGQSESYINESENPLDFGLAKNCRNRTNIQIWTLSHPYKKWKHSPDLLRQSHRTW